MMGISITVEFALNAMMDVQLVKVNKCAQLVVMDLF